MPSATDGRIDVIESGRPERARRSLETHFRYMSTAVETGRDPPRIGQPLRRREDVEMLQGQARYLDDIDLPETAHVAFVRSPWAHAGIGSIDATEAQRAPGVIAVFTAESIEGSLRSLPLGTVDGKELVAEAAHPILATDRVRYVGQPVAAVVAETRALAEDAGELVEVGYEPIAVVLRPREAQSSPNLLHDAVEKNVFLRAVKGGGDVADAFARAHAVVSGRFHVPRLVAAPIETRGALARADDRGEHLTVWCSAQDVHRPLTDLCHVLNRRPEMTRLIVPAVGGAFGSKGGLAPEAALVAWAALRLGRPVKWSEDRVENFLAAHQGRGLDADVEVAATTEGRILGLRARLYADFGAYLLRDTPYTPFITARLLTGVYAIEAVEVEILGLATNRVPAGPYRGAGRPEATFILERMVDLVARQLGLDPIAVRRTNFIPREALPYLTPLGALSDPGDYERCLDALLERLEVDHWREIGDRDQRLFGVGVAMLLEDCGGAFESAAVTLDGEGRVTLKISTSPHGQGHETTFAQIAAEDLGVEPEEVDVRFGDSAFSPPGAGTFGSRSVSMAGSATLMAVRKLREKCQTIAGRVLNVPPETLIWRNGGFMRGPEGPMISLREIAFAAAETGDTPVELRLPVTTESTFRSESLFSTGAYGCVLEIDARTGRLTILKIVAVDDAGRIINPLLAEGQVLGATVQGLGQALFEQVIVNEEGQPLMITFADYMLPTAYDVPPIESVFVQTPSALTPLGARGIGEAGTIGTLAAVANAVVDALGRFGVHHIDPPFLEEKIWRLISARTDPAAAEP